MISWSTQPVRSEDGQCFGRAFGFRDLTAQIAAEEQVKLQSTLLEHVPSVVPLDHPAFHQSVADVHGQSRE